MNDDHSELEPLLRLILAYARREDRDRYHLILALDRRFADIIRITTETLIGQMKLTWWRDILSKDPRQRPTGEPLIHALNDLSEQDHFSAQLLHLIEAWELLLDDFPWDDRQFENYAMLRGVGLFGAALPSDHILSADQIAYAKSWAYWDFARHCSDKMMREQAFQRAADIMPQTAPRFDRSGRPLAILCHLARRDVKMASIAVDFYTPGTAARIIWHGITGR